LRIEPRPISRRIEIERRHVRSRASPLGRSCRETL
jgi:hypothetical protein